MSLIEPLALSDGVADSWFESLMVELSTRFMRLPAGKIDAAIEDAQKLLCRHLDLDRATLWQTKRAGELELTHIFERPDEPGGALDGAFPGDYEVAGNRATPSVRLGLDGALLFPWIYERIRRGQTVVISSLDELPAQADADRRVFQHYGTISAVVVPLRLDQQWLGCLSFATVRTERRWSPALVRRFELVAHLFTHALARKSSVRALRENETRMRAILDTAEEAIITLNGAGAIESANLSAERIFGYGVAELVGCDFSMVIPQLSRSHHETSSAGNWLMPLQMRTGRWEIQARRKDGVLFPVELSFSEIKLEDRKLLTVFVHDITARKKAEDALRESEKRFRLIADSAPVLIWMAHPDGSCFFFNHPWIAFTGRSLELECGNGWAAGIHAEDRQEFLECFGRSIQQRAAFVLNFRLRRHDGAFRWMVTSAVPYFDSQKSFVGYIGSCTDITEQKEAQKAAQEFSGLLIKAQEEQRARLARELHDDVTQRLARMAIDVGRFARSATLNGTEESLIRGVCDGLAHLSRDVHALSYALHPSSLIDLGLEEALRAECEQISQRHSVNAALKLRQLPPAVARETAIGLFRIAQEGLRNAVRHGRATRIEVSLWGMDDGLQLVVHDNGIGFDPSRRRSTPSLGLSSMRERARLLSGDFDIESEPGHGTTIVSWVPL